MWFCSGFYDVACCSSNSTIHGHIPSFVGPPLADMCMHINYQLSLNIKSFLPHTSSGDILFVICVVMTLMNATNVGLTL